MGDSQRADELVRQAEKKLSSFSFFGLNKSAQYDAASSLLEKAANQYKLSKQCMLQTAAPTRCLVGTS